MARSDLAAARASRVTAEMERQRISNEALEATREACKQLISETERQLAKAKQAEADAAIKLAEAEEEVKRAQATRSEADSYREKVIAEAQQEAQRIRDEARSSALQECEGLKRHVTYEVQSILGEVDAIRAAAQEELEAQKIYADTANIKVMSQDIRAQVMDSVDKVLRGGSAAEAVIPSPGTAGSWEVVGEGENPGPGLGSEPQESVGAGQDQGGAPVNEMDETGAPKSRKSKSS